MSEHFFLDEVEAEDAETEQNQTKEQPEKKAKNSAKAKFMRASSVDKFNMSISRFTSEDPDQGLEYLILDNF